MAFFGSGEKYSNSFWNLATFIEDPTLTEYCKLVAHYGSDKYTAPELMKEALGGFQLLDLIITGLKSHMTC